MTPEELRIDDACSRAQKLLADWKEIDPKARTLEDRAYTHLLSMVSEALLGTRPDLVPERIVAEVSKNYPAEGPGLLSERFELVCKVNRDRGYDLESWQLSRVHVPPRPLPPPDDDAEQRSYLNETIVAVFVRR